MQQTQTISTQIGSIDTKMDNRFTSLERNLGEKFTEIDGKLNAYADMLEQQRLALEELRLQTQKEIADLRKQYDSLDNRKPAVGSSLRSRSAEPALRIPSAELLSWRPTKMQLHGWSTWEEKATKAINMESAKNLIAALRKAQNQWAPDNFIDWEATLQGLVWRTVIRIDLIIQVHQWPYPLYNQTCRMLSDFLKTHGYVIHEKQILARLDTRPDLIPLNRACGRTCSWLQANGVCTFRNSPHQQVRPHWGVNTLFLRWVATNEVIGAFNPEDGWTLQEEVWTKRIPNIPLESAYRHLS